MISSMKKVVSLASACLGICVSAMGADSYVVPSETSRLQLLESAKVISVQTSIPKCPVGSMCEPTSSARLRFTLPGCLDTLGPVTVIQGPSHQARIRLNVAAFAALHPASAMAKCVAPNFAFVDVLLGVEVGQIEDVELLMAKQVFKKSSGF